MQCRPPKTFSGKDKYLKTNSQNQNFGRSSREEIKAGTCTDSVRQAYDYVFSGEIYDESLMYRGRRYSFYPYSLMLFYCHASVSSLKLSVQIPPPPSLCVDALTKTHLPTSSPATWRETQCRSILLKIIVCLHAKCFGNIGKT